MYVLIVLVFPVLVMVFLNSIVISVITKLRAKQLRVSFTRSTRGKNCVYDVFSEWKIAHLAKGFCSFHVMVGNIFKI